jgi:hypothetical protein
MASAPQPRDVDALFALPPGDFTAARDTLAKRLRAEGRKEAAAGRGLRSPTVAAWAVNQVARARPEVIERLCEAGEALTRAQRRVLSGLQDNDLRTATADRRKAVQAATDVAGAVLAAAGTDAGPHIPKLHATFEAASLGGEDAEHVRAGLLERELAAPTGFEGLGGLAVVDGDPEGPSPARQPIQEARERAEAAADRARAAGQEAQRARAAADEASSAARNLEEEAERAAAAAAEARAAAAQAETEADDAEEDARRMVELARRRAAELEGFEHGAGDGL